MADVSLAAIAGAEYTRRLATARRKLASGEVTAARAETEMRAWAAIAVLCGADVLAAELAEYRRTIVHYAGAGSPAVYGHLLPEAEARCDLARDLCGPNTWGPILTRARDAAIAKTAPSLNPGPETIDRARNLTILARALDVPLTPASCVIPAPQRKAA